MRLFLSVLVFDIVFQSFAAALHITDWRERLKVKRYPLRLPTWDEIDQLKEDESPANPHPVADRLLDTFDAAWDFFKPWPDRKSRRRLDDWEDCTRYSVCWLSTRLQFCEHLLGFQQGWPMFSPTVNHDKTKPRARLIYADGSRRVVRLEASDPPDLTHYSRWFVDRVNNYEMDVEKTDTLGCLGFCNLLAHRHRTRGGQPLVRIEIFLVRYYFPEPDQDAATVFREQSGPPRRQWRRPFLRVEVKTHPDGSLDVKKMTDD
jgi:hypothetical protein